MEQIEYEVVTDAPLEAIVDLYRAGGWWQESQEWRAIIPAMIRGSYCFMVARDGGRIVGMGRAISDGVSDAYIQDVVVLAEYRKKGIGGALVKRIADYCVAHRIGWVGLVAEPGTEPFYKALGFKPLEGFRPLLYGAQD